ncbi:MAG: hypothetical protein Q9224_002243 [Gallowayella concinna]
MGVLLKRSELTDNVSAKASSGWSSCMSKPMCKWPAILAILLAILLLLTLIYFTLRCLSCCCCNCLSGGRYQRNKRKQYRYADLHSSPYNNNHNTVYQPSHGAPPQYAQFDHTSRGADSLPAMPSWNEGKDRRVYDEGLRKDVEMGKLEREGHFEQRLPMLSTNNPKHDPVPGYAEMDGNQGGDLGQPRPYGQAYMAYSPVVGGRSV